MKKNLLRLILSIFTFTILTSGVYRSDKNVEKYIQLGNKSAFNCVGEVLRNNKFNGSCVLIKSKYILTAAHVLVESVTKPDTIYSNGSQIIVNKVIDQKVGEAVNYSIRFKNKLYSVKKITLHKDYLNQNTKGQCDIAILELNEEVTGIQIPKINFIENELGSKVIGVGYGVSGPADKPKNVKYEHLKIGGENTIDSIGFNKVNPQNSILFADFDCPNEKCNLYGDSKPLPFEYTCAPGDSGGGLFRKNKNNYELIGICNYTNIVVETMQKTGFYGQTMGWIRTYSLKKWIEDNTK